MVRKLGDRVTNRASEVGKLLRHWRKTRHLSQLDLAMKSTTSQRHVSFVESGRTQPARGLILSLSEALDIPLRARNEILLAAGYAPVYPERNLEAAEMSAVKGLLKRMIEHHDPFPAMVLDGAWNVIMRNEAATFIIRSCVSDPVLVEHSTEGTFNFVRLLCADNGLRPHIRSWRQTGRALLNRLRREATAYPGSQSETLLRDLLECNAFPAFEHPGDDPLPATIPLEIDINGTRLKLLTTVTTFGTPLDVSLQGLHIEMSFPADEFSDRFLRQNVKPVTP
jgi:transcriptional regulator with XRE-family HTH domain